ncbi:MAG: thiamine phosphate synthase [Actinobacteria bacterium 13_1_20CM_3_71_11]|nr:MAG: thiamine phosphate synthase [Actinobacteria bacterium 13_1_20CM_3_71_11]
MAAPLGRLHLVTDVRRDRDPVAAVRAALSAGVPVVQVRVADHVSDLGAYHFTALILELCREAGATCLVNDRLHIALATGADGGHVGGDDLPVSAARRVLGPDAILGTTAHDAFTAQAAVAAGASYLSVSPAMLPEVAAAVSVPVIAIGSVTPERIPDLLAAGAYGIAVASAISGASDPRAAAASLLAALASHSGTVTPSGAPATMSP